METKTDEVLDGVYRFSTFIPEVGIPFNQYLVIADEPLLFHTGMRGLFPLVSEAVAGVMPLERLRWISFGHFEADECGAMNEWMAIAPDAQVAHSAIGVMVSVDDQATRPARPLQDGASSTWAASACVTSTRRTSPTRGTRVCCSRRPR